MTPRKERRKHDWEARYQTGQTGWDRGDASPAVFSWLNTDRLRPGTLLIPGCGRGYEAAILAERGFQVTVVDIASHAITSVRERLAQQGLSATLIQDDLLTWQPPQPFDAIYEQTSLCALPPETWHDYANKLWHWLKPEGLLFALFMQTGEPGGPPFHCAVDHMRKLFPASHWQWPTEPFMRVEHPSGRHEKGYVLVRKRAGS